MATCNNTIERQGNKDVAGGYAGVNANGAPTGAPGSATIAKTAAYAVLVADRGLLVICDASGAAFTVTLPTVASAKDGFTVGVKKDDSSGNAVTVDGNGAETIDGAATHSLSQQRQVAWYVCNGTSWSIASEGKESTGGGGSTPTGTGFRHVTGGVEDAASALVKPADFDATAIDPAAGTAGARTLGTGAAQAAAGNHNHSGVYDPAGSAAAATASALQRTSNLGDVAVPATARTNLGLGNSATKNVGTAAGTVAAGDAAPNAHASSHADGGADDVAKPGRLRSTTYLTSGTAATHTPATGTTHCRIRGWGPGGGGGGSDGFTSQAGAGGGGESGGYFEVWWAVSGVITYTVGAGGVAGTAGNNAGSPGSANTTVSGTGLSCTAKFGAGGGSMAAGTSFAKAAGGSGTTGTTGGDFNVEPAAGGDGRRVGASNSWGGDGGQAPFSPGGPGRGATTTGVGGTATYGCGGGGAASQGNTDKAGGTGGGGLIIIEEYY